MSIEKENITEMSSNTPFEFAKKNHPDVLRKAIRHALDFESVAVKPNTLTFNAGRYKATANIGDYDELKDKAREIKEKAIKCLHESLSILEDKIKSRGGRFYLASDSEDACRYIANVCKEHNVKLAVKSKSMTSEEINLNKALENDNIEVVETDLAEFILQIANEPPSHIVAPALHFTRQRISKLFKNKFKPDVPLESGEDLTEFARLILRQKFLQADVGITGANLIAADSGTLLLVESEGNIRMVTTAPSLHIAVAGVEKIVPRVKDFPVFIELLAPSATGQPLSSYTNIINPPLPMKPLSFLGKENKKREFHLVLVDNGRFKMREDKELKETLYCIRCGACMNSCANFQVLGGHAFGGRVYSGGIGVAWEVGVGKLENAHFNGLCTGCLRCVPQCPVKINIPWLNEVIRSRMNTATTENKLTKIVKELMPSKNEDKLAPVYKQFFGNYFYFIRTASKFPGLFNVVNSNGLCRSAMEKFFNIDSRRKLPLLPSKTFTKMIQENRFNTSASLSNNSRKAVLFADIYMNNNYPERGIATAKMLKSFGVDVKISDEKPSGRDALSQGMISTATYHADKVVRYLGKYIDEGRDIVVVEPSILTMFRHDYQNLIEDKAMSMRLKEKCYDPIEYIWKIVSDNEAVLQSLFSATKLNSIKKVFYHGHCQQKSINAYDPTVKLLKLLGIEIVLSNVECCGMAGSFGYKKQFYEVSCRVGEELVNQIKESNCPTVLASGISCTEQIRDLAGIDAVHPIELLFQTMK